jgi:hypothetical protein
VEFGKPWRLVFWREAQYVGCFDIGGLWVTPEWYETLGNASPYDFEPISDKGNRYTYPAVIETGPARTVVHWKYALCDATPQASIFWGNTRADEYYTVYPDGVAVRKVVGWTGDQHRKEGDPLLWETGEIIVINPKGSIHYDNLEPHVATFSSADGDEYRLHWQKGHAMQAGEDVLDVTARLGKPLCLAHPSSRSWREYVITANLRGRPRFFMIFPNDQKLFPHAACQAGCPQTDHPTLQIWLDYPAWKHWPVWKEEYHIARPATEADMLSKCTHTSIVSVDPFKHRNLGVEGKSLKEVEDNTDRDLFMSAEDAKKYGLIDEISKGY